MKKSRTIFIGDIQGCYSELKLLIKKLKLKNTDRVFFVGDIINKGPDSYKTLKYIYKNKFRFNCVKGNHELNFLRWLEGSDYSKDNEFKELQRKIRNKKTNYLIKYIEDFPLYIEEEDFIMLHGGITPNKDLDEHSEDEITRLRDYNGKPWYEYYKGKKPVIYGHWAEDSLQIRKNTKGLDTGCVYGKALTAYILETGEVIQQNALDIYINIYKDNKTFIQKIKDAF